MTVNRQTENVYVYVCLYVVTEPAVKSLGVIKNISRHAVQCQIAPLLGLLFACPELEPSNLPILLRFP